MKPRDRRFPAAQVTAETIRADYNRASEALRINLQQAQRVSLHLHEQGFHQASNAFNNFALKLERAEGELVDELNYPNGPWSSE
jgi:hypothetical protein